MIRHNPKKVREDYPISNWETATYIMLSLGHHRVINFPRVGPWLLTYPLRKMRTVAIPNQSDNYSYLLIDDNTLQAAAVDTFDVQKVKVAADKERVNIVANITTHHHHDHSGGNQVRISPCISIFLTFSSGARNLFVELSATVWWRDTKGTGVVLIQASMYPGVPIYGGSLKIPKLTNLVKDKDEFTIGDNIHIRYYISIANYLELCPNIRLFRGADVWQPHVTLRILFAIMRQTPRINMHLMVSSLEIRYSSLDVAASSKVTALRCMPPSLTLARCLVAPWCTSGTSTRMQMVS